MRVHKYFLRFLRFIFCSKGENWKDWMRYELLKCQPELKLQKKENSWNHYILFIQEIIFKKVNSKYSKKLNRVLLDLLQSRPRRQRIFMPISTQQKWNANVTFYLSEIEIYCQNDTLEDFLRFCMNEKREKFCFISAIFFLENISKFQHFF